MRHRLIRVLLLIFAALLTLSAASCAKKTEEVYDMYTITSPEPYPYGLKNPMKGIRGGDYGYGFVNDIFYTSLVKCYIRWCDIEQSADDGVEKLIEYSNIRFAPAAGKNMKVIPRVFCIWPGADRDSDELYWPGDLEPYDFESPEFMARAVAMIEKMAQAWDNDPRVAYIELGLIGWWGEHHTPTPTAEMQAALEEAVQRCFKNKLIMVRYPKLDWFTNNENFGLYWDEWGSEMQWNVWDNISMVTNRMYQDRWKTAVFGGENTCNCYGFADGGHFKTYGFDYPFHPNEGFLHKTDNIIYYARMTHTNHVGTPYGDLSNPGVKAGMDIMQNVLGYHFVIQRAAWRGGQPGGTARLEFDLINEGSSQLYADWPVAFYLLDSETRQPVWRYILPGVSAGDWMPGERWVKKDNAWRDPAPLYTVEADIPLPAELAKGSYIAAITMLEPAGLEPAARFAMASYINGGFTALGYINIGVSAEDNPAAIIYDDPQLDDSLSYSVNLALMRPVTANGVPSDALADGRTNNRWSADGKQTVIIDLGNVFTVKSVEILFEGRADYEVFISADGASYTPADTPFWGRNDVGRVYVDNPARYVRIELASGDGAAVIKNINVYGNEYTTGN